MEWLLGRLKDLISGLLTAPGLISLGSLVVAVLAYRRSSAALRVQEQALRIESARERSRIADQTTARLEARITGNRFVVANGGGGPALQVEVVVDGEAFEKSVLGSRDNPNVPRLEAGASVETHIFVSNETPPRFQIELRWRNSDGTAGRWESAVSR